jgi:hypothetical protein
MVAPGSYDLPWVRHAERSSFFADCMNELSLFHAGSEILPATCNAISLFSHSMRDGWRRTVALAEYFRHDSRLFNTGQLLIESLEFEC